MDISKKRYGDKMLSGIDLAKNFQFSMKYVNFEPSIFKSGLFPSSYLTASYGYFRNRFIRRMILNRNKRFKFKKFLIVKNIYKHRFIVKVIKCRI